MTEHYVSPESTPEKQQPHGLSPEQVGPENRSPGDEQAAGDQHEDTASAAYNVTEEEQQEPQVNESPSEHEGSEASVADIDDTEESAVGQEEQASGDSKVDESQAEAEVPADEIDESEESTDQVERSDEEVVAGEDGESEEENEADSNKRWYVVKVQSGREESIKGAIERRVKIEGMEDQFGEIVIPVERVTEMRRGKRYVKEKKLFPGYLMVNVEYNDRMLYLFRETAGVGDFVGASLNHPPQPMRDDEVEFMKARQKSLEPTSEAQPQKSMYSIGDRVKVKDGTFAGMEGEVKEVMEAKGSVKVELTIFGRPVPVELEYWQVEFA